MESIEPFYISNLIDSTTVQVSEKKPGYLNVLLYNPPLNLLTPEVFAGLNLLRSYVDEHPSVKVLVFESAVPDFFTAHLDLSRIREVPNIPGAKNIIQEWPYLSQWLSTTPAITIAKIRGRTRGIGNEFLLAMDLRYASKKKAILAQLEIHFGVVPGGGGIEWLTRLVGRSRALEIILSGGDYDADTAERFGWVTRSIADAHLDKAVDQLATRISGFSGSALARAKQLINKRISIPEVNDLNESFKAILELSSSPEAVEATKKIRTNGWGTPETEWQLPEASGFFNTLNSL